MGQVGDCVFIAFLKLPECSDVSQVQTKVSGEGEVFP
jgi:hypothetical protein